MGRIVDLCGEIAAAAEEGPEGHYSVWGEPKDLASGAEVPVPIPEE